MSDDPHTHLTALTNIVDWVISRDDLDAISVGRRRVAELLTEDKWRKIEDAHPEVFTAAVSQLTRLAAEAARTDEEAVERMLRSHYGLPGQILDRLLAAYPDDNDAVADLDEEPYLFVDELVESYRDVGDGRQAGLSINLLCGFAMAMKWRDGKRIILVLSGYGGRVAEQRRARVSS